MTLGRSLNCLISSLLLFLCPIAIYPQDNVFSKGLNAVKSFFKGDEKDNKEKKEDNSKNTSASKTDEKVRDLKRTVESSGKDYSLEQLYELSLDENLAIPKLGVSRQSIKEYQLVQAKKMVAAGQSIETMRGGEVIIATIPSDDLFYPNDTVLKTNAAKYLKPYIPFLRVPDMYRMLLAMHSDDTGTEAYTDDLTSSRVLAVLEWFKDNAADSDYIIPYAMGASEPLNLNNSINNRAKNRRLEIYLVPGKTMIELAKKGQLKY